MMAFYKWYKRFKVFPMPDLVHNLLFEMLSDEQKEYVREQERIRRRRCMLTLNRLVTMTSMMNEMIGE